MQLFTTMGLKINQVVILMIEILIDLTIRIILRNLIFNRKNRNDTRSIDKWNILLKRIIRVGIREKLTWCHRKCESIQVYCRIENLLLLHTTIQVARTL